MLNLKEDQSRLSKEQLSNNDQLEITTKEAELSFIKEINAVELSPQMQEFVQEYNKLAQELFDESRKDFIWKWLKVGVERTLLDCVDQNKKDQVSELIQKSIAIVVMIDDIVDQLQDKNLLNKALEAVEDQKKRNSIIADQKQTAANDQYLCLLSNIIKELEQGLKELPRYKDFQEHLHQANEELLKAFRQALDLKALTENKGVDLLDLGDEESVGNVEKRLSYNMHIQIGDIIMLMGSSDFDKEEIDFTLKFSLYDQIAGNLENDWNTFPDELRYTDFASHLILYAINHGFVDIETIKNSSQDPKILKQAVKRIKQKCQPYIDQKRKYLYLKRKEAAEQIKSFNAKKALETRVQVHRQMHELLGSKIADLIK